MNSDAISAGHATTALLRSSIVAEKIQKIHHGNPQVHALTGLLKDNGFELAPWKDPFSGIERQYVHGDRSEAFELCLEQYINAETKKRGLLIHLELTGDTCRGNSYSFVIKEPNTLDDCGNVGAQLVCHYENGECICFTGGSSGNGGGVDWDCIRGKIERNCGLPCLEALTSSGQQSASCIVCVSEAIIECQWGFNPRDLIPKPWDWF